MHVFPTYTFKRPFSTPGPLEKNAIRPTVLIAILDKHPITQVRHADGSTVPRLTFQITRGENTDTFCLYGDQFSRDKLGSPVGHKVFPSGNPSDEYFAVRYTLRADAAAAIEKLVDALEGRAKPGTVLTYGDGFKRWCVDHEESRESLLNFLNKAHEEILHPTRINGNGAREAFRNARAHIRSATNRVLG